MKQNTKRLLFLLSALVLLEGCVAFPPLVSVEHKESPEAHADLMKRLDSIDRRLDALEHKLEKESSGSK